MTRLLSIVAVLALASFGCTGEASDANGGGSAGTGGGSVAGTGGGSVSGTGGGTVSGTGGGSVTGTGGGSVSGTGGGSVGGTGGGSVGGTGGGSVSGTGGGSVTGTGGGSVGGTGGGTVMGTLPAGTPAFGGSSHGSGGMPGPIPGTAMMAQGVTYYLVVPSNYAGAPTPLLIYMAGTEGADWITQNFIIPARDDVGMHTFIIAAIDRGNGAMQASYVIDDLRAKYNIDNDRTVLISNSAGSLGGEELGFHARPAWFAAYYQNNVTVSDGPGFTATQLGFAPWGNAAPGGNFAGAQANVDAMRTAGYRLPTPAPYDGPGAAVHGSLEQQYDAFNFVSTKSRR